ncbi:MAG TPA: hypothetical protein VML19_22485 [Verrucomicrobiae bacterium]|nr:hypothetical protein [Verrucomicrobiae bacterium]
MNLITTVDHAYAAAAKDVVAAANFIQGKVLPLLQKANTQASTIEAITGLVSPGAANVERAAFAVLGTIIKSVEAAGAAAGSGGLNITLDAALISDIKAIIPAVKSQAAVPAATAAATKS